MRLKFDFRLNLKQKYRQGKGCKDSSYLLNISFLWLRYTGPNKFNATNFLKATISYTLGPNLTKQAQNLCIDTSFLQK